MKRLFCLALLITGCMKADTFQWSYQINCYLCGPFVDINGNPVSSGGSPATLFVQANGTFTTTDTLVNGALTILNVTGARTTNWFMGTYLHPAETDTIGGLLPFDPTNQHPPDNLLYPNGPNFLDTTGVAFSLICQLCGAQPGNFVQLVLANASNVYELEPGDLSGFSSFTLTLVPEPSTLLLLLPATFLAAIVCFRRRMT